jgi:biopolymer transport protein ExbB/TolQ
MGMVCVKDELAQDAVMAAIGKNMAVGGGSSALIFGLAASDVAAFGGLLVAIIGVCIQWFYKRRADRRDAELHQETLKKIRSHE